MGCPVPPIHSHRITKAHCQVAQLLTILGCCRFNLLLLFFFIFLSVYLWRCSKLPVLKSRLLLLKTAWLGSDFLMICGSLVISSEAWSHSALAVATYILSDMSRVAQFYRLWQLETKSVFSCTQSQELLLPPLPQHKWCAIFFFAALHMPVRGQTI